MARAASWLAVSDDVGLRRRNPVVAARASAAAISAEVERKPDVPVEEHQVEVHSTLTDGVKSPFFSSHRKGESTRFFQCKHLLW